MLGPAVRSSCVVRRATAVGGRGRRGGHAGRADRTRPGSAARKRSTRRAPAARCWLQVLESDASRTIETASLSLHAIGDGLTRTVADPHEAQHLEEHFSHVLVGLPFIRSVSLLDTRGQVLISTNADEIGLEIPLDDFGRLPAPDRDLLLPLRPGRGLADLAKGRAARGSPVGMLPLLLQLSPSPDAPASGASAPVGISPGTRERDPRWLLALINPDALTQVQRRALPTGRSAAWLASTDGQLLAAMETLHQLPGQRLDGHPAFDGLRRERTAPTSAPARCRARSSLPTARRRGVR